MKLAVLAVLAASALSSAAYAQDASREALIDSSAVDRSEVAISAKSGPVMGETGTFVAASGGWRVHNYVTLGVAGTTLLTEIKPDVEGAGNTSFYYLGAYADSRVYTWRVLTLGVNLFGGFAQVGYKPAADADGSRPNRSKDGKAVEASLDLYLHLTARADLGFGYGTRKISGADLEGVSDLSGRFAQVTLRGNL